jgi:hypothetical protein
VICASVKRTIHLTMLLTVDGATVGTSDRACHRRADCWSYVLANDAPGNQLWCTTAGARIGGHSLGPITRCEQDETV